MKNYYHILNLQHTASQAEIKKSYRLLAVKYHPDKNGGDSGSEERFKEISEAYIVLGDVAKRNAYDYSKGYQKNAEDQNTSSGSQVPATFLMLFRRIKVRVFHAGGYINKEALFKVLDDLLTDTNIDFLINSGDSGTISLIIDEVLICWLFLHESDKPRIHTKLLKLANGHMWLTNKIDNMQQTSGSGYNRQPAATEDNPAIALIILFVVVVLFIFIMVST
jgi:molecular chaperone DnaJ